MEASVTFGTSQRGKPTVIYRNYEYWSVGTNNQGESTWRCCKYRLFGCKARIKVNESSVVGNVIPEHCHEGNVATALARKALGEMKTMITELGATPKVVQGAVELKLPDSVLMALPKKTSICRTLQRQRKKNSTENALPQIPTDLNFAFPDKFAAMLLFDSGPGNDRLIILGNQALLDGLARADIWLADGTFKVVPEVFFQLYTIHFQFAPGINPVGLYCLLTNKSRTTYNRLLREIQALIPEAQPRKILLDFETASMAAFAAAFPEAIITGCYFHLCQSVIRKVQQLGMKEDYDTNDVFRESIRSLAALAFVPALEVAAAFDILVESMPIHEHMDELVTYFEYTYIRGRRRHTDARYSIDSWNQHEATIDGIARTTNIVEGWHFSLQTLFQCHHPNLWKFLEGLQKDSQMHLASFLQGVAGAQCRQIRRYRELNVKVQNAVSKYGRIDVLIYLRAISHLSYS